MPAALQTLTHLHTDRLRVAIAPHLGAGIASLEANIDNRWIPILRSTPRAADPERVNDLAAFWMIPWCNRISRGRFPWRNSLIDLGTNWTDPGRDPSAIHAIVHTRPWDVIHTTPESVSCRLAYTPAMRTNGDLAWPWRFTTDIRYTLAEAAALRIDITVTNDDDTAMPLGIGFHPFIPRDPAAHGADVRLHAETRGRMEARWLIPTGRVLDDDLTQTMRIGAPLADAGADHAFDAFTGIARVRWDTLNTTLELQCSDVFRRLHLFTRSPRDEWGADYAEAHPFIAVEPVTQGPDAFNRAAAGTALEGELIPLAPGEHIEAAITLKIA